MGKFENYITKVTKVWREKSFFRILMHLLIERRGLKLFLWKGIWKSMTWPVSTPDLNPIENLWWTCFLNGLWEGFIYQRRSINSHFENVSHFDEEYCFKLVEFIPEIIKTVMKAQRPETKYSNFLAMNCIIIIMTNLLTDLFDPEMGTEQELPLWVTVYQGSNGDKGVFWTI